jgi:CheY-like chemotaxis protein
MSDVEATRRRVLLVDDNADVARSIARLVRTLGYDTEIALSGDEALAIAERFQPHVVVMDIGLPGRSGCDTAREIRTRSWGQAVVLIALSGWARAADRQRSLDAGFNQHLVKPVDIDVLEAALKGALTA